MYASTYPSVNYLFDACLSPDAVVEYAHYYTPIAVDRLFSTVFGGPKGQQHQS